MKAAISIIGIDKCASCFLCADICPQNALTISPDKEGFYKPLLDADACTECGLCSRMCPVIHPKRSAEALDLPIILGGWSNKSKIQLKSSSGGVFYEIASFILSQGGKVCGVKWNNGVPVYDMVGTLDELPALMGSKYLQADASKIYKRVQTAIKHGEKVLFVGVPCQIQAVRNLVKSPNLFTIDLVCAGVPSLKMYNYYCKETFPGKEVTSVSFRTKNLEGNTGLKSTWRKYALNFYSGNELLLSQHNCDNSFFLAFNSTKCYNRACYNCSLNSFPRRGQLTLCDYWGATGDFDNEKGCSLILINDDRGRVLLDDLMLHNPNSLCLNPVYLEDALKSNSRINMPYRPVPKDRFTFFEYMEKHTFEKTFNRFVKRTLKKKIQERILRYVKRIL